MLAVLDKKTGDCVYIPPPPSSGLSDENMYLALFLDTEVLGRTAITAAMTQD